MMEIMEDSNFTIKSQRPNKLAGSLKMPASWRGKTSEKIIKESKEEYFKYKNQKLAKCRKN